MHMCEQKPSTQVAAGFTIGLPRAGTPLPCGVNLNLLAALLINSSSAAVKSNNSHPYSEIPASLLLLDSQSHLREPTQLQHRCQAQPEQQRKQQDISFGDSTWRSQHRAEIPWWAVTLP
jgi:hypothetical protein